MTNKVNALATAQPKNPRFAAGTKARKVEFKADLTGANSDDGDIIELAGALSYADRIASILPNAANVPALTSATDNDLGFYYKNEDGEYVEIDKDIIWDGVSLASATAYRELLTGLNSNLDESKNIGQLLGKSVEEQPAGGVYLCLTMNTATSATATLRLAIEIDEATTS